MCMQTVEHATFVGWSAAKKPTEMPVKVYGNHLCSGDATTGKARPGDAYMCLTASMDNSAMPDPGSPGGHRVLLDKKMSIGNVM